MYRQWAQFKLSASIYRYYIAAGATSYFVAPQFFTFLHLKRTYMNKFQEERALMKQKGLLQH